MGTTQGPPDKYRVSPEFEWEQGDFARDLFSRLDGFIAKLSDARIEEQKTKIVVVLQNFWHWTGGMAQYVKWHCNFNKIPYPNDEGEEAFFTYVKAFYVCRAARERFKRAFDKLANHVNTKHGNVKYKDEPAIMAWEIANEAMPIDLDSDYTEWIKEASEYIKSVDPNHLLTIGSLGPDHDKNYRSNSELENIDYMTVHIWPEKWGWFDPKDPSSLQLAKAETAKYLERAVDVARVVRRPLVVSAFALSRDGGSTNYTSSTELRDEYYEFLLKLVYGYSKEQLISGANFWGWSGPVYPTHPGKLWKVGDTVVGDTADVPQGKYSVYSSDVSTLAVMRKYGQLMSSLPELDPVPGYVWYVIAAVLLGFFLLIVVFLCISCRNMQVKVEEAEEEKKPEYQPPEEDKAETPAKLKDA